MRHSYTQADVQTSRAHFMKRTEVMGKGDVKKVVAIYNTENIWHRMKGEKMAFNTLSLSPAAFVGKRADIDLSDLSKRAGFLRVKRKGRKGSIWVSPTLKVCLIPLLLPSALNTEMRSLSEAKRWQSIPGIWLQQGNIQTWDMVLRDFQVLFVKKCNFFLHHEWWSLQITEFNFYTTLEKLWLREESFPTPKGLGSPCTPLPSSQAACRKPSSGYKDWNV